MQKVIEKSRIKLIAMDLDGTGNRPVGVMIANDSSTRNKQAGLDKADMYVEIETEGSIPRIMAVFSNANRLPDKLGPVRSARFSFVTTARAFDIVYCHAGGHKSIQRLLKDGFVERVDALANMGSGSMTAEAAKNNNHAFWRDSELSQKMDYVHSVATSSTKLAARIEKAGYSNTVSKNLPFNFGEKVGDQTANKVQMRVTSSNTTSFIYDSETGLYTKHYGALDKATPHTSLEGNPITATNIVVLFAPQYFGSKYSAEATANFHFLDDGPGYIVSNGTAREIKYTRTARDLTLEELDGTPALLATGKTYFCLVKSELQSDLLFKE